MILTAGPFIGDFKQEIITFLPYVRWLTKNIKYDNFFVSSHHNRAFLYNYIPKENFIPIYEQLSRQETKQNNYIHEDVNRSDFNRFIKDFKSLVQKKEKCNYRNIKNYNLPYIKNTSSVFLNKRSFEKIDVVPENENRCDILFIPNKNDNKDRILVLYNILKKELGVKIIGNMECYLPEENIILKKIDYFSNGYKYIIELISTAKLVITPCSYWTLICNLQGTPVFSWGDKKSLYISEGVYGFKNKNMILSTDNDTAVEIIYKQILYFMEMLK